MDQFYLKHVDKYHSLVAKYYKDQSVLRRKNDVVIRQHRPDMIVCARIRPLLDDAQFPNAVYPRTTPNEENVVDIHHLYNHPRGRPLIKSSKYEVDKLYTETATTEAIYNDLVADLLPFAWNGGIATLFAYGQTGSGKTFTVGHIEKLVAASLMEGTFDGNRDIHMTIIDLAGNSAFDLLNSRNAISLLEDASGAIQLAGAQEILVKSQDEMLELIERATSFRHTAPTFKNDASSRSHAICRIRIEDSLTKSQGLLYLVDLAGSEAARDVAVHGADRMRETREINMSLSVLKDCIKDKTEKKARVPYRQSALTKVLKHVFDPAAKKACKTVVIACVHSSLADVNPTKNTLRYAELLRVSAPVVKSEESRTKFSNMSNASAAIDNKENIPQT